MFESILYKMLQQHLSDYLLNIDSNNLKLGVWSGNLSIENVTLNPKIFELFSLPIQLLDSKIGKMRLLIPWNKLSSRPVELVLENLLIILCPLKKNDWKIGNHINNKLLFEKLGFIEKIENAFIEKILKKQGKPQEIAKGSYFERLTRLILDNMQIKINNIHIRFENSDGDYAFGLKLDFFSMITVNELWKEGFLDRSEYENRDKAINKLLKLENFAGYWNPMDFKEKNTVFSINAQAKFTHNINNLNFTRPETLIKFEIKTINCSISKTQLQQMLKFIEFIASYNKFLHFSDKNPKENPPGIDLFNEKENFLRFQEFFTRLHDQKDSLEENEKLEYHRILRESPNENLQKWTKTILKDIKKKAFLTEQETNKKGWFSSWFQMRKSYVDILSEEEKKEFLDFIEETVKEEDHFSVLVKKPEDFVFFQLEIRLEGGNLRIYQEIEKDCEEGVRFGYKNLDFLMKNSKKSQQIEANLKEFFIEMIRKSQGVIMTCEFLNRNDFQAKSLENIEENLVHVYYESHALNPELSLLEINVSSSKIIYNPQMIKILKDFFDLQLEDQDLRESAIEKLHEIGDKTQASLEESLKTRTFLKIAFNVRSPAIIIPFLHNNSLTNECWVLQSGDLSLLVDPKAQISLENEVYEVRLSQIKLEYFISVKFAFEYYRNKEKVVEKSENSFCLIQEFEIAANLKRPISNQSIENNEKKPLFSLEVSLPNLTMNLEKKVYMKLLEINEHINVSEENAMEIAHNERIALLAKAVKIGEVYKKQTVIGITNWARFFCVLSGNYLYFFVNQKDLNPNSNFYLKNAEVFECEDKIKGNNVLQVKTACFLISH